MSVLTCTSCGMAMALADRHCLSCGTPAPVGGAALALRARAEKAWEAGQEPEALMQMERAIQSGLPEGELAPAWRKLGAWREKRGEVAGAGQAFQASLGFDDSDELSHQLFIANLGRQGLLSQATAFYQKRLDADPADAMAQKQLGVIRLSADFLSKPLPKTSDLIKPNILERWLTPRPWKVASFALSALASAAMCVVSAMHAKSAAPQMSLGGEALPMLPFDTADMIYDLNSWLLSFGMNALVLVFMYRQRKR